MSHPYRGLPTTSFWSSAVAEVGPGELDPVIEPTFTIGPDDRVATMGSCFAQHISRYLTRVGLTYHVTESAPPGLDDATATARNFGVFSARYGNVYTVRQAVQLFERAFGAFEPDDRVWSFGDRYVDPFRPQIEPDGFGSPDEVESSRQAHLRAVREMFTTSDVLVFTLGLTEGWVSTRDGSVFPVAPGVHGGMFDTDRYAFHNFRVGEIVDDLQRFVADVRSVNPTVRFLLTVSPVPLVATYERRHVIVSNTYSKSVLRVVAAEVTASDPDIQYFPSYEIITGSARSAHYFEPDQRSVSPLGVSHVMRVLAGHLLEGAPGASAEPPPDRLPGPTARDREVVCDEELIEAVVRRSGGSAPAP